MKSFRSTQPVLMFTFVGWSTPDAVECDSDSRQGTSALQNTKF